MNDGQGRLTPGFHIADKQRTPYAMTAADLNSDRRPDIVLGYTEGPHSVFSNDGSGTRFVEITFGDKAGAAYGFAIGDIDAGRKPDIAREIRRAERTVLEREMTRLQCEPSR